MIEKALLLTEPTELLEAGKLGRALDFFGISTNRLTVDEFLAAADVACVDDADSKFRLLCTGSTFSKLLAAIDRRRDGPGYWQKSVHSAFVFAAGDSHIAGVEYSLAQTNPLGEWTITDSLPEFCRSMSGIRVAVTNDVPEKGFPIGETKGNTVHLISNGYHAAFVKVTHQSVPIFLSTATRIVDIDEKIEGRDFDIRRHFFSSTPLVLYTKWAFAQTCWQNPETGACLIIDDPLLKASYGFLKFQRLLNLMRLHNFSTTIAFIPWNWRRSSARVVRLFKENPERFSLSIHGCDHSGGEFGSLNSGRLAWKSAESLRRMKQHQSLTGLPHDAIMVFPQGVFSAQSMDVLKRSNFIAAVNSEVISTDPDPRPIRIVDYWNGAVMNYSDFPIFTRRYPSAGIENFAFDILLGKPCLVVVHHNDCHDDCRHIADFIQRLNQLNVPLHWTSLGEVIRRSFRQRELSAGVVEIEIYGSEIRIENPSGMKKIFHFRKRESATLNIKAIHAAGQSVQWVFRESDQRVHFEVELNPGESKIVTVTFREFAAAGNFAGESLPYKLKVMVRRYLSEVRDNYVTRKSFSA